MGFRWRKTGKDKDFGKRDSFHRPVKRIGPGHIRRREGTPAAAGVAPGHRSVTQHSRF